MHRAVALGRGLLAVLLLLGLVVGVPYLLVTWVGWPLPTSVPDLAAIGDSLRGGLSPDFLINAVTVVVWVVWVQLASAVVMEVVALVRGRRPVATGQGVIPGIQQMVGRLVATASLVVSSLGPVTPVAAEPLTAPDTTLVVADPTRSSSGEVEVKTSLAADAPRVTVKDDDTYWDIAELTLGTGRRWKEIRDLNAGRTMNDGTVISAGTSLLRPGWTLVLPDRADLNDEEDPTDRTATVEPEAQGETVEDAVVETVEVEEGDSFWSIAEAELADDLGRQPTTEETATYWRRVVARNEDRIRPPYDPDLIYPGQEFELPATEGDRVGAAGKEPNTPAKDDTEPERLMAKDRGADGVDTSNGNQPTRDADDQSAVGEEAPPDDRNSDSDAERVTSGDSGTDGEKKPAGERGRVGTSPRVTTASERVVYWLDDEPSSPPDDSWVVDPVEAGDVAELSDGSSRHLPLGIGAAAALVAGGVWVVRRHSRQAASPPLDSPAAEAGQVVTVGDVAVAALAANPQRTPIVKVATLNETEAKVVVAPDDELDGWTRLHDGGVWSTDRVNISPSDGGPIPGWVTVGASESGATIAVNLEGVGHLNLSGKDHDVAAVVETFLTGLDDEATVVRVGSGGVSADEAAEAMGKITEADALHRRCNAETVPLTVFTTRGLDDTETERLIVVARSAGENAGVALITTISDVATDEAWSWLVRGPGLLDLAYASGLIRVEDLVTPSDLPAEPEPPDDSTPEWEIRVLGDPELLHWGERVPFRRRASIELLAFLATNPTGADTEVLVDRLDVTSEQSVYSAVSEARKVVGGEHLRKNGRYTLAGITTDEVRFRDLAAEGNLDEAMRLITGPSFGGVGWSWLIDVAPSTTRAVHDILHRHGRDALERGDYETVDEIALSAVRNDQVCYDCWKIRQEAASASGNQSKAEKLQEEYERLVS